MIHDIENCQIRATETTDNPASVGSDAMYWRCAEVLLAEAGWTLRDLPNGQVTLEIVGCLEQRLFLEQRPNPDDVVDGHGLLRAAGAGALDFALAASVSETVLVDEVLIGLNWTWLRAGIYCGIARSPDRGTEGARSVLAESSIAGRPLAELAWWICSLDPLRRSIGLAAVNAFWNRPDGPVAGSHNGLERFEPPGDGLVVIGAFRDALEEPLLAKIDHIPTKLLLGPSAPVCSILFEQGLTAVAGLAITAPEAARIFIAQTGAMIMRNDLAQPLELNK